MAGYSAVTPENFCAGALTMSRRVLRHISQPISGLRPVGIIRVKIQAIRDLIGCYILPEVH